MVRPCVARGFVELASAVLHQCIRPLIGACAPDARDRHQSLAAFVLTSQGFDFAGEVLDSRSFRLPQWVSLRSELNTRSTCRFNALMTPMRAIIVGPLSSTTKSRASTAACHSSSSCSPLGSFCVFGGVFQGNDLATVGQRDRVVKRALPPARRQANRSAPAGVNFTKVPDSCLTNQPFWIAR